MLTAVMALTIAVSGTLPNASAVFDVLLDTNFWCGARYWGVKNHQNDDPVASFGWPSSCVGPPFPYYGTGDYVKLRSAITRNSAPQWDISWAAAMQGTDPWGTTGNPIVMNGNFPHDSTKNYTLEVKWLWTNDQKPTNSDIRAFYLSDLWFKNPSNNKRLVIDFMVDRLAASGGNWVQQGSGGVGSFYYTPYCNKEGGIDTYHYNKVIHDSTTTAGQWNTVTRNINTDINNAFSHTYGTGGNGIACSSSSPGARSSYNLVDSETGIEVQATAVGGKGKAEGGFSKVRLSY